MSVELEAGAELAGYRIESLLGRGAMGAVYLATDLRLERRVALKVLRPELADDLRFRERFLRESRLAASLDHPHIVPIFATGEANGVLYLAMRFVQGRDLHDVIGQVGRLAPERALALLEQVADALDAAHDAGLVHRDVKPGNVLVTPGRGGTEHAYLCDFGLAKHASTVASLASERSLIGTIDYIAPEQIEGGTVDRRADVYGLACVIYECLAGTPPFRRGAELAVVYAHLNDPPPRLTDRRPELPPALDDVIARGLAKDPAARFASAGELVAAAQAAMAGAVPTAPAPPARPQVRTFVIADVRGYTAYTRAHGDAAAARLAERFAALARQAVELHHGELVEIRGDEALAVFDSTRDAIQAAVALQRQSRVAGLERGIGVGIDAGEAIPVGDGFRGAALNLAARLCASCGPGEILASDHATHLAGPVEGVRYAPRKPLRLKGIEAPVDPVEILPTEPYGAAAPVATATGGPRRPRRGYLVAGCAVALAAVVGVGVVVARHGGSHGRRAAVRPRPVPPETVAMIDPRTRRVVTTFPVGSDPRAVAAGGGAVWVANGIDNTVTRVDVTTHGSRTVGLGGPAVAIAANATGVWVLTQTAAAPATLVGLDPQSGRPLRSIALPSAAQSLTLAGGAAWMAGPNDDTGLATLLRVPLDGNGKPRVIHGAAFDGAFEGAVGSGAGAVWAAGVKLPTGLTGLVVRVSATGAPQPVAVSSLQQSGDVAVLGFTRAIAVDGAGVWLLRGDRTLWRLDAASGAAAGSTALGAGEWSAMTTGDGSVFVADTDAGVIEQISEADGHIRRIPLGNASGGLAFAGGYLWSTIVPSVAGIAGADAAAGRGGTLRVVSQADPGSWDGSGWDPAAFGIESATCDGLLDYGRYANGTEAPPLVPAIAAAMPAISADGRVYTFRIRSGLHFSNGKLVTAADVRASYLRALDPKANSDTTTNARVYFNALEGYSAYEKGARDISGIAVHGDEVSFHLTRAYGAFPYLTAHRSMCIVPSGSSHFATTVPPPMTGPYRLGSYVPRRAAVFTRNPYWRENAAAMGIDARGVATVDRIVVQFGVSPDDQVRMIERGEADVTMYGDVFAASAAFRAARARLEQAHEVYTTPDTGLVYLWMRADLAPFRSRALRQAVSYAIDRTRIAPLIPGGNDHPWSALLPSTLTVPGARQRYPLVADQARARALVRSTGLPLPIVVDLPYVGDHRFQFTPAMKALAADLNRVGFRVHLEPRDVFAYFNELPNPKSRIQIGMQTWSEDLPDPISYLEPLFLGGAVVNNGRFDDAAVNRALLAAAALPLGAARTRAYAAVEATLEREAPAAMLGEADQTFVLSKRVRGFAWNAAIGADYARISLAGS